jgi:glucokinase
MAQREIHPLSCAEPPYFVGIDLGGTNIKSGLVDNRGRILGYARVHSEVRSGPEAGSQRMANAAHEAVGQAGLPIERVAHIGLVTPGTMDLATGMLLNPPNLPGWSNFPIRDRVSYHTGLPVAYANDANAAAYGEFWVGSGSAHSSMLMLTLGTGVGGGIIEEGRVLNGQHSHGGECGHMIIDPDPEARLCGCGQRGHLEAYASATAIVARTREAIVSGRASVLAERPAERQLTPLDIHRAAEAGDKLALEMILETARYLGLGITTLMHILDPAAVVLGGAMDFGGGENVVGRKFLETVTCEVQSRTFPVLAENVTIAFSSLGGDAGFIGAAGIGRLAYQQKSGAAEMSTGG